MRAIHLAMVVACTAFAVSPSFAQGSGQAASGSGSMSAQNSNQGSGMANQGSTDEAGDLWGSKNPRQALMQDLQKAGFTNVHIRPEFFIVRAKNSQGQPVVMRIGPDSMEAVTAVSSSQNGQGSGMHANNGQTGTSKQ